MWMVWGIDESRSFLLDFENSFSAPGVLDTLLEKFGRISLYVTDDDIAKLYVL